jgi:glycosyltransferase involved in cell wall biosynthesis
MRRCLDGRPIDVYRAAWLNRFLIRQSAPALEWSPSAAENGELGAARLALGVLQARPDVRRRFPRALSEGIEGGYAHWLCTHGAREFGLSARAVEHVRAAFGRRLSDRVFRLYGQSPHVQAVMPLALTPAGRRQFARALLHEGKTVHGLLDEEIWWYLFEAAEDPSRGVAASYLNNPGWQMRFPLGLTAFGQDELLAWLRKQCPFGNGWLKEVNLSGVLSAADEVRLLWNTTPALRRWAPGAFREPVDTKRLLRRVVAGGPHCRGPDAAWCRRLEQDVAAGLTDRPGVNLLGYFCYPSGLGEAARMAGAALELAGVQVSRRAIGTGFQREQPTRADYLGLEVYPVTVLILSLPLSVPECYVHAGLAPRPGVHRVAVWYWELESFQPEWVTQAGLVDEVWAPTRFIARALRGVARVPVREMLPGVQLSAVPALPRSHFGLPEDHFLFLFVFDMHSYLERKNPLAVLRAYRRAFRADDRVALLIKVSGGDFDQPNLDRLRRAAAEAGAIVIDRVLSREESYGLMNLCDCYVSLHRSEGFGLTMAEAMLLGKPVIATAYSGNLDFMTADNSLLVDYERVPIAADLVVYKRGSTWAEPSVEHAAAWMRWAYENPVQARALGEKARRQAGEVLSLEAAGQRMARRLLALLHTPDARSVGHRHAC